MSHVNDFPGQRTDFFDREGDQTIVDVDMASGLHNLGDVLVVEPQDFLITFLHVLVIERELDCFPLLELDLSSATLNAKKRGGFFFFFFGHHRM